MLKRKIESELYKWKMNKAHKPLIIKGLRQSGKTYSVVEFAKNNYENAKKYLEEILKIYPYDDKVIIELARL